jgi:16S rRNA (uracil1498-N3)-methyltransferase
MKKIHRFLITETPSGKSLEIADKDLLHLVKNVLKMEVNEECIVFTDNSDDYLTKITNIGKTSLGLEILSVIPKKVIPKNITACVSITKRDSFETTVQKLTEIGVETIVPIISDRTIKQTLRTDRLQKISNEALEQSGGSKVVKIAEPQSLEKTLEVLKEKAQCFFDMDGEKIKETNDKEVVFYIGPEGGWSANDKELFKKYKLKNYKLGEKVLRAETAAIIASYTLLWD